MRLAKDFTDPDILWVKGVPLFFKKGKGKGTRRLFRCASGRTPYRWWKSVSLSVVSQDVRLLLTFYDRDGIPRQ